MADEIDRAQQREQQDRDLCIQRQTRPKPPGTATCDECGGGVSDLRREAGARFCMPCQEGIEAEAKRRSVRCCK